jgi:hypothetical protein
MLPSGMLCRVDLVRNDISEECGTSLILVTLMMEALRSSETSILTSATWRNIPEDDIHHNALFKTYDQIV